MAESEKPSSSNVDEEETCENYENLLVCVTKFVQSMRDQSGSCKKLAKAYPKCYKEAPEILQMISDQIWNAFEENQKSHMLELIGELNLKSKLCGLANANHEETKAWRPSGVPSEDVKAHLMKVKEAELAELTEMKQQVCSETEVLRDELSRKEKRLKLLMKEMEEEVMKWEEMDDHCSDKMNGLKQLLQQGSAS